MMRSQNLPATSNNRQSSQLSPFDLLHERMDRMFDDFASGFGPLRLGSGFGTMGGMPSVSLEMHEENGKLFVNAELPGVDEKDIDLSVEDDVLTISGEKRSEYEGKENGGYRTERSYGSFSRSVQLPFAVDPAKVQARYERGVLKLTIDRPPEAAAKSKKIPITH
jgi:HSP20 family protein